MRATRVGTLVVIDTDGRLAGLLTSRDLRFVDVRAETIAGRMTPRARLVVHRGTPTLPEAEAVMRGAKVKKLPLVDEADRLVGLVTAKDLTVQRALPFATRSEEHTSELQSH